MKARWALETLRGEHISNVGSCGSCVTRVTFREDLFLTPHSLGHSLDCWCGTRACGQGGKAGSLYSWKRLTVVSVSWWLLHNSFTNCHAGYILQSSLLCHMRPLAWLVLPQRPKEVWEWNTTDSISQKPVSHNTPSFFSGSHLWVEGSQGPTVLWSEKGAAKYTKKPEGDVHFWEATIMCQEPFLVFKWRYTPKVPLEETPWSEPH